jgi:hypothetical protein
MRKIWIAMVVASAVSFVTAGYAAAQDKQPSSSQQMQKDRDPPPGDAQTGDKRGERAETPAPMNHDQGQKPADAQGKN